MDVDDLVVVTTTAGEKLVGKIAETNSPDEKIRLAIGEGQPVELTEVRSFIHIRDPKMDAHGRIVGIPSFLAFMPPDMFMGPADRMSVMVSCWYSVKDNPGIKKQVAALLDAAEKNEKVNSAQQAGLSVPGRH